MEQDKTEPTEYYHQKIFQWVKNYIYYYLNYIWIQWREMNKVCYCFSCWQKSTSDPFCVRSMWTLPFSSGLQLINNWSHHQLIRCLFLDLSDSCFFDAVSENSEKVLHEFSSLIGSHLSGADMDMWRWQRKQIYLVLSAEAKKLKDSANQTAPRKRKSSREMKTLMKRKLPF